MSYVKADVRKYLKKYADTADQLQQIFDITRKEYLAGLKESAMDEKITSMQDKIQTILNSTSAREKQIANLDNRQILWEERTPHTYVNYIENEEVIDQSELNDIIHRLGRTRLEIKIHLKELIRLKYNLPVLESYEKIQEFNPQLPKKMKLIFFIFGQKISSNCFELENKRIINSDFKQLRMSKSQTIETVVNFDMSRLVEVEKRFLQSQIQIICTNQHDFIIAEGSTPAYNLITKQLLKIGLKSPNGIKIANLNIFIETKEEKTTKQSQKQHILNDRIVAVPAQMAQELQIQIISKQKDSPMKRSQFLDKQSFDNMDIKVVKRFKDMNKPLKNKSFLDSHKAQKVIEVFDKQAELISFPIQNSTLKSRTVKLQYKKLTSFVYDGESNVKFILSQDQLKELIASGVKVPTNLVYTPFSQLSITDTVVLEIPARTTLTILIKILFNLAGTVQFFLVDQTYTFMITDYQHLHYQQLKKLLAKDFKQQQQPQLAIHYGLKFLFTRVPMREDSIKSIRGYWQKLLIPTKVDDTEKIHFITYPSDIDLRYTFHKQNCEIHLRCFSTQLVQTVAILMFNANYLQQINFVKIELENRKVDTSKTLRVKANHRVYKLDIAEFMQEDIDYHFKSMKPNILKILTQNAKYGETDRQRHILLELQKIIEDIELEIIIYDEKNFLATPIYLVITNTS